MSLTQRLGLDAEPVFLMDGTASSSRAFLFPKDGRGKNFRHEIYADYKANREAMPEELARQIPPIERMVRALGLPFEESEGCEAYD